MPDQNSETPENNEERPDDLLTQRAREKQEEDERFVGVIVKRTDESRRHADDVLENTIIEGLEQLKRPALSLFISAIAAGLIVGFSAMAVGVVMSYFTSNPHTLLERFLVALVYPLGFVVCVMSGAELFTEHTATAVYPVLDRRVAVYRMIRLWGIVLAGNLIGALGISCLLVAVDDTVGAANGYIAIGHHLIDNTNSGLFFSALLAGWLMAQGAWLVMATPPALTQVVCIFIVTFLIGLGSLHHAIAGSVEMFTAYLISDEFTITQASRFIGLAAIGNLTGGFSFVALLNYAHIRRTQTL